MSYTEPTSSRECAARILALAERLLQIKRAGGYSDPDARGVALTNCRISCLAAAMVLNILSAVEERRLGVEEFRQLVGMTTGPTQEAGEILSKTQRLSFLVIFQFQVENLVNNLIRELGGPQPKGFYTKAREVVVRLADPARKLEILNTPALIRNSLHANGIHHGHGAQSFSITLDGYTFRFDHEKKVSSAGWGHIALACNEAITVIDELLNVPAVRVLTDPIMDHYAWEEATRPDFATQPRGVHS